MVHLFSKNEEPVRQRQQFGALACLSLWLEAAAEGRCNGFLLNHPLRRRSSQSCSSSRGRPTAAPAASCAVF